MKPLLLLLLLSAGARAHMVSMSSGEVRVEGARARYELRVPLYEVAHVKDPERTLLDAVVFSSAGAPSRRTEATCRQEKSEDALICIAVYEFAAPVEVLTARSRLHAALVANHVHLLRATRGDVTDQALLDLSFPQADIRFRPPTSWELAVQHAGAGALRVLGGLAQWLFLAALVLAARSRRELFMLTAMFCAGEVAAALIVPQMNWTPAPAFIEAASALTIAYLAVEILLFPEAGQRWLVVAVLGAFHGLYFAMFTTTGNLRGGWVMAGVLAAELPLLAAMAWLFSRLARPLAALRPVRAAAALLVVTGLVWFAMRLKG
ncbi:MAG: HupE/UreJ family protein [Bryobacterales bacterium]|nr:HupE/UreJ family protein [Bryobacterales bacterium]